MGVERGEAGCGGQGPVRVSMSISWDPEASSGSGFLLGKQEADSSPRPFLSRVYSDLQTDFG